jgi:hydrogenase nickel incorporation protein HypA/HybF
MHELSIAQGIVTLVDEAARGRRIARVNVEIGAMSGVAPDAITFSFDLVTEGTCAEGARLNIIEIPATARCEDCGLEFPMTDLFTACSCGSFRKTLLRGGELNVRSIELAPQEH